MKQNIFNPKNNLIYESSHFDFLCGVRGCGVFDTFFLAFLNGKNPKEE